MGKFAIARGTGKSVGLIERVELADAVVYLMGQGIEVSIDDRGVVAFEGVHDGLSPRAIAAIETLSGRERALRLVLAADVDADAARALEHERESLKKMREGGLLGPRVRWGKAKPKPKAPGRPGRRPGWRKTECLRGHDLMNPANVYRDRNGWATCLVCRARRRERERKRPGPKPQATCRRGLHLLDAANISPAADGRRRCLTCIRQHDRERDRTPSAPTATEEARS